MSGSLINHKVSAYRSSATDVGDLNALTGSTIQYGHSNNSSRKTSSLTEICLYPLHLGGSITDDYGIFIANDAGVVLPTNYYGLYQQDVQARNYFAGNVGIGLTNPGATLDVSGTARFLKNFQGSYPTFGSGIGTGGLLIGWNGQSDRHGETDFINFPGLGTGGFNFVFANSGGTVTSTPMVISPSGNVGIGTTAPAAALDVPGGIRVGSAPGTPVANTFYQDAIPRAWARFGYNGSSTVISASFNVASVNRTATGRYTVNWTTPFSSSNYAVICTSMQSGSSIGLCGVESYSTGSIQVDTTSITNGNSGALDNNLISIVAFGAQ